MTDLTNPIFHDEAAARAHLESQRWPNGPACPHCGFVDNATRLSGEAHRPGLLECRACRKQFSVTVGTVFERSHVPLHKWVLAVHLTTARGVPHHVVWGRWFRAGWAAWSGAHGWQTDGASIA